MISFDYYKVFYYVCKYKSFTKAANVLRTSQSGVSHTILNLEHQLGCRLFVRENRGIDLTPEGENLYQYVSIGCEQFFKGESEISNSISLHGGIIYLGTTETALHCYLLDALDQFHILYPNVKFKISNMSTIETIQALKNGIVDLAVTATPFDLFNNMKAVHLKKIQDILIAGMHYHSFVSKRTSLKEICNYPIITYSNGSKSREFIEHLFLNNNLCLSPTIESATSDLILAMVKHNLGIGFIPYDMAKDSIEKKEILQIQTEEQIPSRNISLIYDVHHPKSLASEEFRKFITSNAKENIY